MTSTGKFPRTPAGAAGASDVTHIQYLPHDSFRCHWLHWHTWRVAVEGKWDQCIRCGRIRVRSGRVGRPA